MVEFTFPIKFPTSFLSIKLRGKLEIIKSILSIDLSFSITSKSRADLFSIVKLGYDLNLALQYL